MVRATFLEERRTWEERARPARPGRRGVLQGEPRQNARRRSCRNPVVGADRCLLPDRYGVPVVIISMLLLKGNVSKVLDAVAPYRPDLLHHTGVTTGEAEAVIELSKVKCAALFVRRHASKVARQSSS